MRASHLSYRRLAVTVATSFALGACSAADATSVANSSSPETGTTTTTSSTTVASLSCLESGVNTSPYKVSSAMAGNTADHEVASDYVYSSSVGIALNGSSIAVAGAGATVSGSTVTIGSAGTYMLTGTLTNGQVLVTTSDTGVVRLVLNGVTMTNVANAPIVITKAKKAVILLADNSTNRITDGVTYPTGADQNAAIYSKSKMSIGGNGALVVNANFEDGITSKDGLVIAGGNITVTAKDDGIRGKDYLVVRGGTFNVTAGGDGFKSDNDSDVKLGYVRIDAGTISIAAVGDAISAETAALVSGGTITTKTSGGSSVKISDTLSAKGLKGGSIVVVDDGKLTFDNADDAVHSNGNVVINGGTITIATGDDGVHADSALTINAGTVNITKSYEGLESGLADMTINGGNIHVVSTDDGVNLSGAGDTAPGGATSAAKYTMRINGGRLVVNALTDGLDANGSIAMSNGCVIVNGPTANNNAPIDYDGTFTITGGFLVAAGSSGMAQQPGTASTQATVMFTFSSAKAANSIIHVQTSAGEDLLDFAPLRASQSLVFSSPGLKKGSAYDVYFGGTSSGTATDGVYQNGIYSGGAKGATVTLSAIVNKASM